MPHENMIGLVCKPDNKKYNNLSIMSVISWAIETIDPSYKHPLFQYFTTKDACELGLVCSEMNHFVRLNPWDDETQIGRYRNDEGRYERIPIGVSLRLYREYFPHARTANVSGRYDLDDADFVHLRGLTTVNISQHRHVRGSPFPKASFSDIGFQHLRGVRKLIMMCADMSRITDRGFESLRGIEELDMYECDDPRITGQALVNLRGIRKLNTLHCNWPHVFNIRSLSVLRGIESLEIDDDFHPYLKQVHELPENMGAYLDLIESHDLFWVNALGRLGFSILYRVLEKSGTAPVVHRLVELGADVKTECPYTGLTPLHVACQHGSLESVRCLLDNGADVNYVACGWERTYVGATPLCLALHSKDRDVIELLLERGAMRLESHWTAPWDRHRQIPK
jgi:hypothetical protein